MEPLEEIRRLLILGLTHQGVQGKRVADVLDVDPSIISRILTSQDIKKKEKKSKKSKKK